MFMWQQRKGFFVTTDEGGTWEEINNGLLTKDVFTLAIGSDGQLYAGTRGYGIFKYLKNEERWEQTAQLTGFGLRWHVWNRPVYQYTSLLIDPTNNSIMYFGVFPSGMFKSTDGGETWKESNLGLIDDGADGIFSLTFHPHNKSIIYAGTYNGISVSYDAGGHWKRISKGIPPEQWVYSIAIDPTNTNIMYAVSKNGANKGNGEPGFQGTALKTINSGEDWFEIVNGLNKENEFYTILIDPENSSRLFLCSSGDGVFISLDAGENWTPMNEGLTDHETGTYPPPNVAAPLKMGGNGTVLYLGTRGSGVFKRYLKTRVLIDRSLTTDNRCDVDSVQSILFHFIWLQNNSDVTDATVYVNGTGYVTNSSGWIAIQHIEHSVKRLTWVVTAVNASGMRSYLLAVPNPSIIWDNVKIIEGGATHTSTNITQIETVWFKAQYEFDGEEFGGSKGTLYVNNSAMIWSSDNNRWESNYTFFTPAAMTFQISYIIDSLYNLTVINDTIGPQLITWHHFQINNYTIPITTNSAISHFAFDQQNKQIKFNVTSPDGLPGFCNVTIPKQLLNAPPEKWTVLVDGEPVDPIVTWNTTHTSLYFTYVHSTHKVTIVPEFPSFTITLLFIMATISALIIGRRRFQTISV